MLSIVYLMLFLSGGAVIARLLLPRLKPVLRVYLGLSLGVLLLMWLPVLWAYAVRFSYAAHWLALGTLALLVGATVARLRPLTRRRSGRFGCCLCWSCR